MLDKKEMHQKQIQTKYEVKLWLMEWTNFQDCVEWKYANSWGIALYDKTTTQWRWMCYEWPLSDIIILDRADIEILKFEKWVQRFNWCHIVPRKPIEWKRFEKISTI